MKKQTVFIKRYPSKGELPKEHLHVIVFWNEEPLSSRIAYRSENGYWFLSDEPCDCDEPDYWLEEIELPSDEEITIEADKIDNWKESYEFERGAKFILNKIKN